MENLIGDEINKTNDLIADGSVSLHLYGKVDIKPGRKMGHFNRIIKLNKKTPGNPGVL